MVIYQDNLTCMALLRGPATSTFGTFGWQKRWQTKTWLSNISAPISRMETCSPNLYKGLMSRGSEWASQTEFNAPKTQNIFLISVRNDQPKEI